MRMKLKTFEEAMKAGKKAGWCNTFLDSVAGLYKYSVPWGQEIIVDRTERHSDYILSAYDGYMIPDCCFENNYSPKSAIPEDVLRYSTILTDDQLYDRCDEMAAYVRIRIVSYDGSIFYVRMVNGKIDEFKKIGEIA